MIKKVKQLLARSNIYERSNNDLKLGGKTKQLNDRIWNSWTISCLHGWKITTNFDKHSRFYDEWLVMNHEVHSVIVHKGL